MVSYRKLRGYWGSVLAVGWLITGFGLAQDAGKPTLESQPVAEPRQEDGGSTGNADAATEGPKASELLPAIRGIESAIRDLIPKKDEAESNRQNQRDVDDLKAQQDMAIWAKGMFWATIGTIITTVMGLILIWRTLHHTRRAADYAADMVNEAKKTTDASHSMLKSERAWMLFNSVDAHPVGDKTDHIKTVGFVFNVIIKNFWRSPAVNVTMLTDLYRSEHGEPIKITPPDSSKWEQGHGYSGPGAEHGGRTLFVSLDDIDRIQANELIVVLYAIVVYNDIFGNSCMTDASVNIIPTVHRQVLEAKPFNPNGAFMFPYYPDGPNGAN